jgi:hypothetical protein
LTRKVVRVAGAVMTLFVICFVPATYFVPAHPFLAALGFFAAYIGISWVLVYLKDAMTR